MRNKLYRIRNSLKYGAADKRIANYGDGKKEQDEIKRNSVEELKGMVPNKLGGVIKLQGTQLLTELATPAGVIYDATKMFEVVLDNIKLRVMFDTDSILLLIPSSTGVIKYLEVPLNPIGGVKTFNIDLSTLYYVTSDSKNTIILVSTSGAFKIVKNIALLDSDISADNFEVDNLTDTENLIYKNINLYRLDNTDIDFDIPGNPTDSYVQRLQRFGANWLIPVTSDLFVGDTVSLIVAGNSYDFKIIRKAPGIRGVHPSTGGLYVYLDKNVNTYILSCQTYLAPGAYASTFRPSVMAPATSLLNSEQAVELYILYPIGSRGVGVTIRGGAGLPDERGFSIISDLDLIFGLPSVPERAKVLRWNSINSAYAAPFLKESVIPSRYLPLNETVQNTSFSSISIISNRAFSTIGNRVFVSKIGELTTFAMAATPDVAVVDILSTDAFNFSIQGETRILSTVAFNDKGILLICERTFYIIPKNNTSAQTVLIQPFVSCPNGVSFIPPVATSIDTVSGILYTNNNRDEVWFLADLGINNAPRNEELSFYTPYFKEDKIRKMLTQPTMYGSIVWVLTDSGLLYGLNVGKGKDGWFEFGREYNILDICVGSDPDPNKNYFELNIVYELEGVKAVALFSDAYLGNIEDVPNSDVATISDVDTYTIYRSSVVFDSVFGIQEFIYLKQKDNTYFNVGDIVFVKSLNTNASFEATIGAPIQATLVHSFDTQAKYIIPICSPVLNNFKNCRLETVTVFPIILPEGVTLNAYEYFLQNNTITETVFNIYTLVDQLEPPSVGGVPFNDNAEISAAVYELGISLIADVQKTNYIRPKGTLAHVTLFPDEIISPAKNTKGRYKKIEETMLSVINSWNFNVFYLTYINYKDTFYTSEQLIRKFNDSDSEGEYNTYNREVVVSGSSSEKNIRVKITSGRNGRLELDSIDYTLDIQQ